MRKSVVAGMVVGLGIAAGVPTSATAASTCTVGVPKRIAINSEFKRVGVSYGDGCSAAGTTFAFWSAYHPTKGLEAVVALDEDDGFDLHSFAAPGPWTWRPGGAHDGDGNSVPQNRPVSDVRYATRASLSVRRSGSRVSFTMGTLRYSSSDEYIRFRNPARAVLQAWNPSLGEWRPVKEIYANNSGTYSWTYRWSTTRSYRVQVRDYAGNPRVWGSVSAVVRK